MFNSYRILFAFDDVSLPLPPMRSPDIRRVIMEEAERRCIEEGVDPSCIKFLCSIALHRFIREDEFRHICGNYLYDKYSALGAMGNYNAVDEEHSVVIGVTEFDEEVKVCRDFADADMLIYANCNYVAMDGGYKVSVSFYLRMGNVTDDVLPITELRNRFGTLHHPSIQPRLGDA